MNEWMACKPIRVWVWQYKPLWLSEVVRRDLRTLSRQTRRGGSKGAAPPFKSLPLCPTNEVHHADILTEVYAVAGCALHCPRSDIPRTALQTRTMLPLPSIPDTITNHQRQYHPSQRSLCRWPWPWPLDPATFCQLDYSNIVLRIRISRR